MKTRQDVEKKIKPLIGQSFICPDGETRKLKSIEVGTNDWVTLYWGQGKFNEYNLRQFIAVWPDYQQLTSEDELPGTPAPAESTDLATTPVQTAEVVPANQLQTTVQQAKSLVDNTDIVQMMKDQMHKVAGGNPVAINQANAMANLAKQIVEAGKLKLDAIKTVHALNQPVKP